MKPSWEDLEPFFDDFGVDALFGPEGSEEIIRGLFDDEHAQVSTEYYDTGTSQPMFTCPTPDVGSYTQGARVVIHGVEYTVKDKQANGTGITEVYLHVV